MLREWRVCVPVAMSILGCFTYAPVDTTPSALIGKRVAVGITDRGRIALSPHLGGGVLRLEGTVTADDSAQYVMHVLRVSQIGGETTPWAGETVRIDHDFVGGIFERRLSRSRTFLATGAAVTAIAWFVSSQGLFGSGDESAPSPKEPGPVASRVPR
jgi:hypothetical protein